MSNDRLSKLIGLFFLAVVLLNFPIIGLLGKNVLIGGIPLLYLYVFTVWLLIIFAILTIINRRY